MQPLTIKAAAPCDVTVIANRFFDDYMPRANGEFVKIYLYLVRLAGSDTPLSLSGIADRLNYTEQDVMRALRYWQAEKVLSLEFSEDGSLRCATLANLCPKSTYAEDVPADLPEKKVSGYPVSSVERRVSALRMRELEDNEDIKELLFIAQRYLGKMLTPSEAQKLLYFYDELHFTTDLIEFLIEYCASKDHKNIRYIEKVALSWYEEGITTVKAARQSVSSYHKDYYDILKALGQGGRHPIDAEITLMKKWIETYAFSMDIIREACTRCVMNTKQPSLKYTDGILTSWHEDGVKTLDDIRKLDAAHAGAKKEAPRAERPKAAANRFTVTDRHAYDFDEIESRLLAMESN